MPINVKEPILNEVPILGTELRQVLALALRACVGSRFCLGIHQTLRDWFGEKSVLLFQNLQIIVWANSVGGGMNFRFLPCATHEFNGAEGLFFEILEAMERQSDFEQELEELSGFLNSFALPAFETISEITGGKD